MKITEEMEMQCVAIRVKNGWLYCYPFLFELAQNGAKVLTRGGLKVTKIHKMHTTQGMVIQGIIGEKAYQWQRNGRYNSDAVDSIYDLYIPERYFYQNWKDEMPLSNAEWFIKHHPDHPYIDPDTIKKQD